MSLLHRVPRDHAAGHQRSIAQFSQILDDPAALIRFLGAGLGELIAAMVLRQPQVLDELRRSLKPGLDEMQQRPAPAPTEHWALTAGYEGIERAQLIVVNVRHAQDRDAGERIVREVARLRRDEAVYRDVMGLRGNRLPVTAVVADLSEPRDAGLKKAIARVKRAMKRRTH